MANVTYNVDTKLSVTTDNHSDILIGHWSKYVKEQHPGTKQNINGWQFDSRIWPSEDTDYSTIAPSIVDPDLSMIPKNNFQSGVGPADSCLVEDIIRFKPIAAYEDWAPEIHRGSYYQYNSPYYLYSDNVITEYVDSTDVISGVNFIVLRERILDGIPIHACTFKWDEAIQENIPFFEYKKKTYFTGSRPTPTSARLSTYDENTQQIIYANIDTTKSEFIVTEDVTGKPKLIFNKLVGNTIGIPVVSGADLASLELLGASDGTVKQLFHTKYNPIDKNLPIEIYTYLSTGSYQAWTPRINTNLTHSGFECLVDTDLGTIQFGDQANGDQVPPGGYKIVVRYSSALEVKYEPEYCDDIIISREKESNINPMARGNSAGFVIIKNAELLPYKIKLYTDLPQISTDVYSPLDIGNNPCPVHALVTSKTGEVIEGLKVNFKLLDEPPIGLFANATSLAASFTNIYGVATVFYIPPKSIDDIGEYIFAGGYSTSGGNTTLTTQTLRVSSDLSETYLYKVWTDDPTQGVDLGDNSILATGAITAELNAWYKNNFFTPESIYGPTGLDALTGEPSGDLQTGATAWENKHRIISKLLTPQSYNRLLRNGRKQIVSTWSASALDPHFHQTGAFIPLSPTSVTKITDTVNQVTYNSITLGTPGVSSLDAYFLISPTELKIQANVYDEVLDKIIYSNVITVKLHIPDALNGTVHITDINSLPPNIVPYILNSGDNGKILPLGFKIKQSGNTFASAIQGVTYLDINTPGEMDMTFNVDIIR